MPAAAAPPHAPTWSRLPRMAGARSSTTTWPPPHGSTLPNRHGRYPVVDNHAAPTEAVRALGARYLGERRVTEAGLPMMGAEDFSYFLLEKPGCFFFLGGNEGALQGWAQYGQPGQRSNCMCHNTAFDFNDNLLPLAAVFWVRLVEARTGAALYTEAELPMPAPPAADDDAAAAAAGGLGERAGRRMPPGGGLPWAAAEAAAAACFRAAASEA